MKPLRIILATLITMLSMNGFAQENNSHAVLEIIHSRKSVRSYTDEPVAPEQVQTLLKAAMAAPSGRNLQPWRFVVVTKQDTKDKLAVGFNKMIAKAPVVQKAFHNWEYEMELCPLTMLCKATFNWLPVKPLAEL